MVRESVTSFNPGRVAQTSESVCLHEIVVGHGFSRDPQNLFM